MSNSRSEANSADNITDDNVMVVVVMMMVKLGGAIRSKRPSGWDWDWWPNGHFDSDILDESHSLLGLFGLLVFLSKLRLRLKRGGLSSGRGGRSSGSHLSSLALLSILKLKKIAVNTIIIIVVYEWIIPITTSFDKTIIVVIVIILALHANNNWLANNRCDLFLGEVGGSGAAIIAITAVIIISWS